MKKHFVTFLSPGTFTAEQDTKEIDSWDVEKARKMAGGIEQRYGAVPYGFYFSTRERRAKDFDSKQIKKSGMYYLKGRILTLEALKAKNDKQDEILIDNMINNKWDRMFESTNGWRWTQPLEKNDTVLEEVE